MHDFEVINQYRNLYLCLIKKHSEYSVKASNWRGEIEKLTTCSDVEFRDQFPRNKFIEVPNEIERIKKVMRWVNESLMYQRQEECPYPLSAGKILKHVYMNKVTVNCLSHAIVLNECLESLGIISRIIFCFPMDINPSENHVIVQAYSKQYGKWIALDPSWNCYYCDAKGEIMSLEEIRQSIVRNLPFSIQYNHRKWVSGQSSQYKKYFTWENLFSYLCKNLFRFTFMTKSDENTIIQYELIPSTILDGDVEIIDKREGKIFVRRFLTNSEDFWCIPVEMD